MRVVPAVNALHWLRIGWQLFMRNPLIWILSFAAQTMMTLLLMQLPLLGSPLAMLIVPAFSAGFLSMAEAADKQRPVEPVLLFDGFRRKPGPLLGLGGLYLIGGALLILLTALVVGTPTSEAAPAAPGQGAAAGVVLWFVLMLLLHMAFWFAPALVLWQDMPPLKAVFFSFFSCWRNWRAFVLYLLTLLLFITGAALLASVLFGLLFGGEAAEAAVQNFLLAFVLGFMPTVLASVYASYRDVFAAAPSTTP